MIWIKKEWLELTRQYKLLIIGFAFTFFAILEPLMIKLLPHILGSELEAQGIDISLLASQEASAGVMGFMGDVFQIIPIVLAFAFSGYFSKEISRQTLIIPLTKGRTLTEIFLSKYVLLTSSVLIVHFISGLVNFFYSNILFPQFPLSANVFLLNHFYSALILVHFTTILLVVDVWVKKSFASSLITLGYFFIMSAVLGFFRDFAKLSPLYLTREVGLLSSQVTKDASIAIVSVVFLSALAVIIGLIKVRKMNLTD